jgi:hypothetical protein
MASFDDRKKGMEEKFRHDQELTFKINNRRNKLLGLWAAGKMGLSGEAADAYAKEVVASDFEKAGEEDVVEKVAGDLKGKGLAVSPEQVRDEMKRLLPEARKQIAGS